MIKMVKTGNIMLDGERGFLYVSVLGVVAFIVAFVLGTALNSLFGPMMGGFVNAVITAMIIAIACRPMEKFPYATITWISFSIPAIFTTTMGPPGVHKIVIAALTGLIMEVIFIILGRTRLAYFIAGVMMSVSMTLMVYFYLKFRTDLNIGMLEKYLIIILAIYGVLGGIGMWLGVKIFDEKLKDIEIFRK